MSKKIYRKDKYGTIYDDGSAEVTCSSCGKLDKMGSGKKIADAYYNGTKSMKDHLCLSCWKKDQDEKKDKSKDKRQDKIRWGQAYNNAVSYLIANPDLYDSWEKFLNLVAEYQERFCEHKMEVENKRS